MGRTGLSIMLSCLEGILLQSPNKLCTVGIGLCSEVDSHYDLHGQADGYSRAFLLHDAEAVEVQCHSQQQLT